MVATRNHPKDFQPPPAESPTKRSTRSATERASTTSSTSSANQASPTKPTNETSPPKSATPLTQSPRSTRSSASSAPTRSSSTAAWSHTPSNMTLIWLAVSLPLVIWDTGYVVLRPYSLPGGSLHYPLWVPYDLYGTVDHVYSAAAYHSGVGWTAAQGSVNAVETAAYLGYLYLVYAYGQQEAVQGRGAPDNRTLPDKLRALGESRTVYGRVATWCVVLGYSTAWLTFSKTVLYWLNEAFSGFSGIGHNGLYNLIFVWIIPNGAWLVFPLYMMYVFGQEILQGLELAAEGGKKSR